MFLPQVFYTDRLLSRDRSLQSAHYSFILSVPRCSATLTWEGSVLCPQCHSLQCRRSRRRGAVDFFLSIFKLRPWRCVACEHRFYAWLVPASLIWYVHCPRCGIFQLERIGARHISKGLFHRTKRVLGMSAYRCDPCRTRFFSVRPYREIHALGTSERKNRKSQDLVAAQPPQT